MQHVTDETAEMHCGIQRRISSVTSHPPNRINYNRDVHRLTESVEPDFRTVEVLCKQSLIHLSRRNGTRVYF